MEVWCDQCSHNAQWSDSFQLPFQVRKNQSISGWWFQTCFIFHNIWDNYSHWRTPSFFKMLIAPPSRFDWCAMGWEFQAIHRFSMSLCHPFLLRDEFNRLPAALKQPAGLCWWKSWQALPDLTHTQGPEMSAIESCDCKTWELNSNGRFSLFPSSSHNYTPTHHSPITVYLNQNLEDHPSTSALPSLFLGYIYIYIIHIQLWY